MKIVYIPIVIPVHVRTLVAMSLCALASVLMIIGLATNKWLTIEMHLPIESSSITTKLFAYQSLEYVDVTQCEKHRYEVCYNSRVVYSQCDDTTDSWCAGRVGFLVSLGAGVAGVLVTLGAIGGGLVRERFHGLLSCVSAVCTAVALVAYYIAYQRVASTGMIQVIQNQANYEGGSVTHSMGYSFTSFMVGAVALFIGAATSMSLRVVPHHDESRDQAVRDASTIQVVEMDIRASDVAIGAPKPGFVRLEEDEDDDGLIMVPPALDPSSSPYVRQTTLPPSPQEPHTTIASDAMEDLPHTEHET